MSEIPESAGQVPKGGSFEQKVSAGGKQVTEIVRAAAPIGRTHGYLARQLSEYATAGCTCGWFSDGPAETVLAEFEQHAESHA